MRFPFSFSFERELTNAITPENEQRVLEYIETRITKRKANTIVIEDSSVIFKGSTGGRGSLFIMVDQGVFSLVCMSGTWNLVYQINMKSLFIETGILSAVIEACSLLNGGPWWIGIVPFLWLCGANWAITLIRQGSFATEIATEIDDIICEKAAVED